MKIFYSLFIIVCFIGCVNSQKEEDDVRNKDSYLSKVGEVVVSLDNLSTYEFYNAALIHDGSKEFLYNLNYINYSIDVYDMNGNQLYRIRKDFRKIAMNEHEVSELNESENKSFGDNEKRDFKINYKRAIDAVSMYEDKDGNLLVQVPLERNSKNMNDFVVDAFKDGIFLNRFKMDIGRGYDFYNSGHQRFFIGDRIYYQNRDENYVKVFIY
jgi:hypothetical protein